MTNTRTTQTYSHPPTTDPEAAACEELASWLTNDTDSISIEAVLAAFHAQVSL